MVKARARTSKLTARADRLPPVARLSSRPGYNRGVDSERWLPIGIFAGLVLLIAAPFAVRGVRDALRPELVEVRIVTAAGDGVFREGARRVDPGEQPAIAVALRLRDVWGRKRWVTPADTLELDGVPVDHEVSDGWPERDRQVRVFWFTVECSNVGGVVTAERAARLLRYRSFLASEMGRGLRAAALPEPHNDDSLGPQPHNLPVDAGTLRLYARVEVFDPKRDVRALQSASSAGPERVLDSDFPAIHRAVHLADGLRPEMGELFNLSGWEVEPDDNGARDAVAAAAFGLRFAEAVERRLAVSSATFAAVATTGKPNFPAGAPAVDVAVDLADGTASSNGKALRWGEDVRPGDVLIDGSHYTVLVADDGGGILSVADTVVHCWRRPPAATTLGHVLPASPTRARLVRHGP